MARYAELYNGTVLEFPDDTPDEVISRVAREETLKLNPPESPVRSTERTVGEAIADVPVSALSGIGSVVKFPGQLVSLIPGLRGAGETLSAPGEYIYQAAQGLKSEGLKVREALRSEAISEAEKDGILSAFATAITSTLKDPALISTFIAEQVPQLLPAGAASRLARIGKGMLRADQLARRSVAAAVGTGAAMQAADVSEGAYKRTLEAGLQQGMSPEEAESAANQAARLAAVGAGATSLLVQKLPGAKAIEERLARVPGTSGRLKSGFGEATSESLEEAGGQVFANLGVRTVDPNQSLTESVGAAAGFGALGGGFFGTLLGKKAPTPIVPGQREGESIEQAVSRLVAERDALRETQLPSGILGGTELAELASRMGDDGRPLGYGLLTNYIEQTALLPDSPAKQQSIEVAESIRQRLNIEEIQRQKASQTNIITSKDLMDVGFTPQDPVYQSLVGKDLFKPEDAQTVLETLDNERKLDLDSERAALVGQLYQGVSNYLDTLPGSGFYAPERGTDGRGVEVSDQRRPVSETRPPEVDEGGVDSDTTVSGGLDVGEEAKQPSLRFMTEKGSFYEVDESGNTARTKLSPGKGQGTTYEPHPVLYVSPENLREIQSDMVGGMGDHTPRLGYRQDFETGSVFKPITSRSEIPEGAEPYVAVVNRNNGNIVGVYPAQLNPEVGLHPVEKLYKDGKSFTHLGNKITELVQDFEIVTPKLLKDLEIDIKSGVAKRVLGKKVEDVLEDLAKAAPSKKSLLGVPEAKFRQLETESKKEKPIQKVEKEPTEEELSVKQKIEDLNKQIEGLLRQVLNKYGLKDVSLKIVKDMAAKGEFSGRLIKLADDTDNPLLDLRHETIHALKELGFFSPAQWKTLEDRAQKEWIDTYLKNVPHDKTQSRYDAYKNMFESEGLTEEGVEAALIEEAIADAFSFFAKEKAPPGLMNAIKNRMQNLFKALKEFLGTNNLTAEDIFGKIEEGKLPPVVKGKAAEEPKKSLSSGVPRSTRLIMESSTPFAQNELGLRTEKPKGATGANNVRDIAQALNNQTIQNFGGMTREQLSAADANDLARALADEVGYQLRATAQTGTGLGWYSNNYPKAIDKLSARFPELKNNKTARSVFTACVAISSNGEDVTTNIKNAILMYEDVRAGKKIRQIGARRADALQRNKEKVIALLNRYGDNFTTELLKTTTVKEMNAGLRALGEKPDTSYLANTTVPVAAIYFGPKLGAFYANLMGAEGYLTMDMWWTRTMNRMRGLLMPEATQSSINKFQEMIGVPGLTRQQVVDATIPFRNKYEAHGYTTELEFLVGKKEPAKKDELPAWTEKAKLAAGNAYDQLEFEHRLEKMANTIYKNEFEMLQEAPFTGSDRAFMYKVARDAQAILKQEGIDLSLADIQAAIWYYEKRLYAKLSGRLADDIGYDEAISRSVTNNRRARPSLVFPDGPNSGYVPPRRDRDADQVRGKPEEGKLSLRSQTDTPAFKKWFGESKVVDENGNPLVVYHSTFSNVDKFKTNFGSDEYRRFGAHVGSLEAAQNRLSVKAAEDLANRERSGTSGANVMPVYVNIKNPLRLDENRSGRWGVDDIMRSIMEKAEAGQIDGISEENVNDYNNDQFDIESWLGIKPKPGDANYDIDSQDRMWSNDFDYSPGERSYLLTAFINQLGYDGIVYKNTFEGGGDSYIAIKPTQIKSAIGNIGTFDVTDPDIRRSLRSNIRSQTPPQILNRIDATIGFRDDVSLPRRMMNAISPRLFSEFRANAINRYNELAELDKRYVKAMGGPQLLADSSAEAAALFSDLGAGLTASALGVHDRVGGVPVFRNGVTVISNLNNTVKGPLAIFEPLAKYGDPEIFRLYQFWASVKRGSRLAADGKVTPFNDPNDVAYARQLEQQYPEFVSVQRDWTKYNDGLVDFMEATGIITPEASTEFKAHGDYFPFYRYAEFDDVTGPRIFASIANVPVPKKLKGGEAPLGDFFENVIRNTQAAIQMGIKNVAAQRATELSVAIGEVTPLPAKPPKITPDVYRVLENGKEKYYRANDILFINAIKSLNIPDLPFIGLLSAPANVLRNLVTKTPDFMMANMLRDSVAAWVTSGKKITPVIATLKNFGTAIAEKSPELTQLRNAGVLGGYDYAQGVEVSGKRFAKDLRKISKTRTDMEKLASPFTSIWDALEKGSAASDAATRMEVYKKTLQETGNEAEALYQALEVMNFNRKGRSAVIRILTAAVPFLNARIQGLDLLYRAGIRPFFDENATDAQMARAKTFWVRGMTIMALSAMYWAAVSDDDDWKKQEQETRDNYWILPEAGIKIPIPFEIGVMFKVIPERILEYSFGDDTGKDFLTSMKRQLVSTFAFNPIPQTFLPIVESATNHSFFTQRPIISQGMEGVAAEYQAMPTTSRAAIGLADGFNAIMDGLPPSVKKEFAVSPIKLEHLIQGYTGSMGTYALQLLDYIIGSNSEIPSAETRFERMPVIRRFLVDPQARGQVTAYYDLKNATDEVVRTSNYLERTANYEDLSRFMSDNYKMLANKGYISDLEKTMKEFREMKVMIQSSRMSRESKRSALDSIEKMELQLTKNISFLKK